MLIASPSLILDGVVGRLALTAFALAPRLTRAVPIECIKWLRGITDNAIFVSWSIVNVLPMIHFKVTFLDDFSRFSGFGVSPDELVTVELRCPTILKEKTACGAHDREVITDLVCSNEQKVCTFVIQALKHLERDVAHALHVFGTQLSGFLNAGIWGSSWHNY
jgi:hypothetical protein